MSYSKTALWEMSYPFILSIGAGLISYLFAEKYILDFLGLINASLNVFGILIGFLITVLTIINSIENSYTRALIKGGSYHLLSVYLIHAIWGCFLSIICGICYIFFYESLIDKYQSIFKSVFILSFVFALFSSFRFIKIFLKLSIKKRKEV